MKIKVYDIESMKRDFKTRDEYNNFVNKNVTFNVEGKEYDGSFIFADYTTGTFYVKLKINGKIELVEVKEDTILTFPESSEPTREVEDTLDDDMDMVGGKRMRRRKSKRKSNRRRKSKSKRKSNRRR